MTSGHPHHRWRAKSNAMATGGAGVLPGRLAQRKSSTSWHRDRQGQEGVRWQPGGAAPPVGLVVFRSFEIEVPT
jgi:hypothetical protein